MVFHRRARHGEPMIGLNQPAGLGCLRLRVLDRLRFIENRVIEPYILQLGDITAEDAVGGYDQVEVLQFLLKFAPFTAAVIQQS